MFPLGNERKRKDISRPLGSGIAIKRGSEGMASRREEDWSFKVGFGGCGFGVVKESKREYGIHSIAL